MEDKRLMDIYQAGVRLKKEILNQSEKDNIYKCINAGSRAKLMNAPSCNNPKMFIEAGMEICQRHSLLIPKAVMDCLDISGFKYGSRAFICGLFSEDDA